MKYFLIIAFISYSALYAEIKNCNGTWSNTGSCNSDTTTVIPEIVKTPQPTVSLEIIEAEKRLNNIRALKNKVKKEFCLDLDILSAELACEKNFKSIEDCLSATRSIEDASYKIALQPSKDCPTAAKVTPGSTITSNTENSNNNTVSQTTNNNVVIFNPSKHIRPSPTEYIDQNRNAKNDVGFVPKGVPGTKRKGRGQR